MKKSIHAWSRGVIAFCAATVVSSLFFAEANSSPRPIRGQPIQTRPPRGEPIQPIKPVQPAESVQAQNDVTEVPSAEVKPNEGSESASLERKGGRDYFSVGFDKLASFDYLVPEYTGITPPPAPQTNQIPNNIQSFDGRRVALKGFMLPLKVEGGKVTELLLMRDQSMCCFGTVPKINEFVTVKMLGSGTRAVMDQAVTLYGTLKVGEFTENGYLLGIYQMDGELADGPGI